MNEPVQRPPVIRVLVADDHPIMRQGMRSISQKGDIELVGEAADGTEAVEQYRKLRPTMVLMDLHMPGVSGLDAIGGIRGEFPDANIIVLTSYPGDARIMRALYKFAPFEPTVQAVPSPQASNASAMRVRPPSPQPVLMRPDWA
jgi:CheY-like chemotaxis protein